MKRFTKIMIWMLLIVFVFAACRTPRDYRGHKKKKISMGWM